MNIFFNFIEQAIVSNLLSFPNGGKKISKTLIWLITGCAILISEQQGSNSGESQLLIAKMNRANSRKKKRPDFWELGRKRTKGKIGYMARNNSCQRLVFTVIWNKNSNYWLLASSSALFSNIFSQKGKHFHSKLNQFI